MAKTKAKATSKKTFKQKAGSKATKQTQKAKDREDTKEKMTKGKKCCGHDKAAAVMRSSVKMNVAASPGRHS
eukprot:8991304-Ditylum_brightwellii.AAC.1